MKRACKLAGAAGFASSMLVGTAVSQAALVHRFSFNDGTGNDSVGTVKGTLTGTATITTNGSTGALVTTGAAGQSNGLFLPAAVGTGITGDFSVQDFVTIPTNPNNYSSLFSFSSAQAPGSATTGFLLLNPSRGGGNMTVDFEEGGTEVDIASTAPFPFGTTQHDVAVTYNSSNNAAILYLDGVQVGNGSIGAALATGLSNFNFQAVSNGSFDGIAGNPPYGDPGINGTTDDLRIYNAVLPPAVVASNFAAGPNALAPEPTMVATAALGGVTVLARRRRRSAP